MPIIDPDRIEMFVNFILTMFLNVLENKPIPDPMPIPENIPKLDINKVNEAMKTDDINPELNKLQLFNTKFLDFIINLSNLIDAKKNLEISRQLIENYYQELTKTSDTKKVNFKLFNWRKRPSKSKREQETDKLLDLTQKQNESFKSLQTILHKTIPNITILLSLKCENNPTNQLVVKFCQNVSTQLEKEQEIVSNSSKMIL